MLKVLPEEHIKNKVTTYKAGILPALFMPPNLIERQSQHKAKLENTKY